MAAEMAVTRRFVVLWGVGLVLLMAPLMAEVQAAAPKDDIPVEGRLDDGTQGKLMLIGMDSLDHAFGKGECEPGTYEEENGNCSICLAHNAPCTKSRQCCSVDNMACWKYGMNEPLCKCNMDYGWDESTGLCYLVPVPMVLVITAYTALGAACIVGCTAICIQLCRFCKGQYNRCRYGPSSSSAARRPQQFRQARRHHGSAPPRLPRVRTLSEMEPREIGPPLPNKPPAYEDVYGMPTISQSIPRRPLTGSIRSLPPAYSLAEPEDAEVQTTEATSSSQTEEATNSQEATHQEIPVVPEPQSCTVRLQDPEGGVMNPAFVSSEHHM